MRIKHMLTLAFAAMVAVAFAVPAVASAWTINGVQMKSGEDVTGVQWSKDGAALSGESGSLSLSGPLGFTSPNGGVSCTANASVTLNPNSSSGQLTALTMNPTSCTLSGGLVFLCGGTKVVTTASASALPWSVNATESAGARKISISGVALDYTCASGFKFSATGNITATPDNSGAISSLTLSGTGKSAIGDVQFTSAPLSVTPAGKYGIEPRSNVAISGTLGWTSVNGGMSCTVNGNLTFEGGSTAGKVISFNWSNCTASGALVPACGGTSVSTVSDSLPWGIVNQGSSIKISNASFTATHPGCVNKFNGDLVAAPNNKSAISSTTLAGTLKLNPGNFNTSWSGSVNWTPAGVYGL